MRGCAQGPGNSVAGGLRASQEEDEELLDHAPEGQRLALGVTQPQQMPRNALVACRLWAAFLAVLHKLCQQNLQLLRFCLRCYHLLQPIPETLSRPLRLCLGCVAARSYPRWRATDMMLCEH